MRKVKSILFYTVAIAAMSYSVWQLDLSTVLANGGGGGGTCCTTSSDCPNTLLCYYPSGGLADCDPAKPNYCR